MTHRVLRGLAAVALVFTVLIAGCGGDPPAQVTPAPDRSAQIRKLRKQVVELEQRRAARRRQADRQDPDPGVAPASTGIETALEELPGQAGLVVGAPGRGGADLSAGTLTTGSAWSTIKIPIAERVLGDAGGPNGITSAQSAEIDRAITLSDNDAAASLFSNLEASHGGLEGASAAVTEMLRQAGDTETVVSTIGRDGFSTYGQTEWSLLQQNRYMAALAGGCVSDSASRSLLLDRMSAVTAEPWGLGALTSPAKWKGGWGPGVDGRYLVRQMGVVESGGREIVVTLAATADDGSFETAQAMATSIAELAVEDLGREVGAPASC